MTETNQQILLQRGKLQLAALAKQAAAAKAEADRAELEVLLTEAEAGRTRRLADWLQAHSSQTESDPERPRLQDWSTLRQHSMARLPKYLPQAAGELRVAKVTAEATAKLGSEPAIASASQAEAEPVLEHDCSPKLPRQIQNRRQTRSQDRAPDGVTNRTSASKRVAAKSTSESPSAGATSRGDTSSRVDTKRVAELVRQLDTSEPEEQGGWLGARWARLRSARGVTTSVIVHVLLVLALAFVTLKLPEDAASLAIESAAVDSPAEPLEMTAPVEAQPLEDTSEPVEFREPVLDSADALSEVQDSLSDALDSVAPVATSAVGPSAAALAASASAVASGMSQASFYGAAASGNNFCFVIDGSGSMRDGPWEAAKLELLKSLSSLQSNQRFYIIFFNRELSAIPLPGEREPAPRALYATPENLQHARRWVDTLKIDIGAPPNKALALAISKEPDAIYLLTDGVTSVDVAGFLRRENRVEDLIGGEQVMVPIHTIAFYSLEGQQLLRQIADENTGQFIYVPDPRKR